MLQLLTRVTGQVQQGIDLSQCHSFRTVGNVNNLVARLNFPFVEHAKIKSRLSARGQQSWHLGLVHPHPHAIAGDTRLGYLEYSLPDPVPVADEHLVVRHTFNSEVLAELSVSEIASIQSIPPISIRLDLVDEDRALLASVTLQISLSVAVDVESSDHAPALNRLLPDRRMHRLPAPYDVAWQADVNRQKSRHQCFLSRVVGHPKPLFNWACEKTSATTGVA